MAQLFNKSINKKPAIFLFFALVLANFMVFGVWYFFSPKYTDVGYEPEQPVPFSHKIHAGKLDLDCQYCHYAVSESKYANVPATQVCMNCHEMVLPESENLALVRESWNTGKAIEWVRVHNLADYAYFNHQAHVTVGVGCESCHGRIDQMDVVRQVEPLSMGWCLDCHRAPENFVRPIDEVTTMGYKVEDQQKVGKDLIAKNNIHPPTYCQGCHY